MADGLASDRAARAVGEARANLYRWEKRLEPRSRRPARLRKPVRPPGLVEAIERLRLDFPMWGRAKLGPLVREQGSPTPPSGASSPNSSPAARFNPPDAAPASQRPALDRHAASPSVCPRPHGQRARRCRPARHRLHQPRARQTHQTFTAYDPIARWTVAKARNRPPPPRPRCASTRSSLRCPSPSTPSRSTEQPSSWPSSGRLREKGPQALRPPQAPQINGGVERCNGPGDTNSTPSTTCRDPWRRSIQSSTASSTSTTITDHTEPLAEKPHPTTLHNEQPMRPTHMS